MNRIKVFFFAWLYFKMNWKYLKLYIFTLILTINTFSKDSGRHLYVLRIDLPYYSRETV